MNNKDNNFDIPGENLRAAVGLARQPSSVYSPKHRISTARKENGWGRHFFQNRAGKGSIQL